MTNVENRIQGEKYALLTLTHHFWDTLSCSLIKIYHNRHLFSRFIGPMGQLNSLTKSSELESGPKTRNFPGEWGSVRIWFKSPWSVIRSHQTCNEMFHNRHSWRNLDSVCFIFGYIMDIIFKRYRFRIEAIEKNGLIFFNRI